MKIELKIVFLLISHILLVSCNSNIARTTTLDSIKFDNKSERIRILSREIVVKSVIEDCDFELFNVNGFDDRQLSLPGASSVNYKFGLIISKEDVPKWLTEFIQVPVLENGTDWEVQISKKRSALWKTQSSPKYYISPDSKWTFICYEAEGILFGRYINN